jgi:hypothetical protein
MSGAISKADLKDADILDKEELGATGSNSFLSGVTVVSTDSGTKVVTLSSIDLGRDDERLEPGDTIILTGTTAADGTYTVGAVTGLTTFTVNEAIATSTGGTLEARHPVGAGKIGLNSAGMSNTSANDVQQAIADVDAAVTAGGLTPTAHRAEDVLVHDLAENAFEEVLRTGNRVDSVTNYTDGTKTTKIREEVFTYTGNQVTTIVEKQFDAAGLPIVGETKTSTLVYTGVQLDNTTVVMS